jgi:hypothetical protein
MRKAVMIGLQNEPEHWLYAFRLESHVATEHLRRGIDARLMAFNLWWGASERTCELHFESKKIKAR